MVVLKVEDLRGVVEDDIIEYLNALGVKSLIKGGIGRPELNEKTTSVCGNSKMVCVVMSYELVDSLFRVISDLKQSLSDVSFIVLLSRKVDSESLYVGALESQSSIS
mgnify:FL=1